MFKFSMTRDATIRNENCEFISELPCNDSNKMCIVKHDNGKRYVMKKVEALRVASIEYSIGKALECELLLCVFDIDFCNLVLCIPHFESQDLFDKLHNSLDIINKRSIWDQVIEAIDYLHTVGIAHCDIKSENILVNENGEVKLIDFATVQICNARTKSKIGTISNWTPEQCLGIFWEPIKSDVWCLGLLLYELCTERGIWGKAHESDEIYRLYCLEGMEFIVEACNVSPSVMSILKRSLVIETHRPETIEFIKETKVDFRE
jgi:serine/threonine protein kinase